MQIKQEIRKEILLIPLSILISGLLISIAIVLGAWITAKPGNSRTPAYVAQQHPLPPNYLQQMQQNQARVGSTTANISNANRTVVGSTTSIPAAQKR